MMASQKTVVAALTLVLLVGTGSVTAAQVSGRADRRQEGQDRLIEMFLNHATAELNLTADQRSGLEAVLQETLARRSELARSQLQLQRRIREALSNPQTSDGEFNQLADDVLAARRQEVELSSWQQGRLLDVLSPRQALRFMLLQEQLAKRIEELRKRRANDRL